MTRRGERVIRLWPWFLFAVAVFGAASCGDHKSAGAVGPKAATSAALSEEDAVPVEVDYNGRWVVVRASRAKLEGIARLSCAHRTVQEDKVCAPYNEVILAEPDYSSNMVSDADSPGDCKLIVCRQRNETCAGYLFATLARSPTPTVLSLSSPILIKDLGPGAEEYGDSTTSRFRLQNVEGSARTAALRAALDHFQLSTAIARDIRTLETAFGTPAKLKCIEMLQILGQIADNPDLAKPEGEPSRLTWTDVYYESFIDAANEYSMTLQRGVDATTAAATGNMRGDKLASEEVQYRWSRQYNSQMGAARLLSYGEWSPGAGSSSTLPPQQNNCSTDAYARRVSPHNTPMCRSISTNEGVQRAMREARSLHVSPAAVGSPVANLVAAYNEDRALQGETTPLGEMEVLSILGIGHTDVEQAQEYLCAEKVKFGITLTEKPGHGQTLPPGFTTVPRYWGTGRPVQQLAPGVVAAHLLGMSDQNDDADLSDVGYVKGGGIRVLDQMKATAVALKSLVDSSVINVHSSVRTGMESLALTLKQDVGDKRLELLVGPESSGGLTVESVTLLLHGVPPSGTERYFAVQGLTALKCATQQTIDGAPCPTGGQPVWELNQYHALDARMIDLDQATETIEVQTDLASAASKGLTLRSDEAIYVLREKDGVQEVLGGAVPTPGTASLPAGNTRRILEPVGGIFQRTLGDVMAASTDDCSMPDIPCGELGLSSSLVPPLESEINGDQTTQGYENAWYHYLEVAKSTSEEADRLGEELVAAGLEMDKRMEDADDRMLELCGPDGTGSEGCTLLKTEPYVTLGDKPVCLWRFNHAICGRPDGVTLPKDCPFIKPADTTCEDAVEFLPGAEGFEVVAKLGFGETDKNSGGGPTICKEFDDLRKGNVAKREDVILNSLVEHWTPTRVANIAKSIKYYEDFGDNYRLTYNGKTVFDTNRQGRPSKGNADQFPPCVEPTTKSGSSFWEQKVPCFVSGVDCSPAAMNQGIGLDGCRDAPGVAWNYQENWSLDTEPEALQNRWAWGFGHLRRSVATLGVMTGQLSGMMDIPRMLYAAYSVSFCGKNLPSELVADNLNGWPCTHDAKSGLEPQWVLHCKPWGDDSLEQSTRCIEPLAGAQGVGNDANRMAAGRPVNWNGFIPNRVSCADSRGFPDANPWSSTVYPRRDFPWVCEPDAWGGASPYNCGVDEWGAGADPQMVYCGMPHPSIEPNTLPGQWGVEATAFWNGAVYGAGDGASGWVGSSYSAPVKFNDAKPAWIDTVHKMWKTPTAGFCGGVFDDHAESAVWRALCFPPGQAALSTLKTNREFMHFGRLPEQLEGTIPPPFVGGLDIAGWLLPSPDVPALIQNQWLFDLREASLHYANQPFQYPLDSRNILDALELACHVETVQAGAPPPCRELEADYVPNDLNEVAEILRCHEARVRRIASSFVVGPIPLPVIQAFGDKVPLASTAGYGGAMLEAMVAEYDALAAFEKDLITMSDSLQRLGMCAVQLQLIYDTNNKVQTAISLRQVARGLAAAASALAKLGQGSSGAACSFGNSAVYAATSAYLDLVSAGFDIAAMEYEGMAQALQSETAANDQMQTAIEHMRTARDAAKDATLQLNSLTNAAARLELVRAQGVRASARSRMADFAGENGTDPQFVNTVMRRIYNTKQIRYEKALTRARKAAYVARRAIEVRFGVDMSRMTDDMTFVEAPQKWADQVCTWQGINYADIRTASADAGVEEVNFEKPQGGDFATAYIGDYVKKLEDFVRSYPFNYPLKDGDDTAVISLGEDIFRVKRTCWMPSDNRLAFSTEFDKRSSIESGATPVGWFVRGCEAQKSDGVEWTGCVEAAPKPSEIEGLPAGAVAYRLRHQPCISPPAPDAGHVSGPDIPACPPPDASTTSPRGVLAQEFVPAHTSVHMATVYVNGTSNVRLGMRVVRVSDGQVIISRDNFEALPPWLPVALVFPGVKDERYRLELWVVQFPAPTAMDPNDQSTWPSVNISAAQVAATTLDANGDPVQPPPWQRTGLELIKQSPVCHDLAGSELRTRFQRKCEYVCKDGIHKNCGATDPNSAPSRCFYEATFGIPIESIESGKLIPSGQIAIGNFNYRHNLAAINLIGTGVTDCSSIQGGTCYLNGFAEYTLIHSGDTKVRNWHGSSLPIHMDTAFIEHGKALAAERSITNPLSSTDNQLLEPYLKGEFKGRPIHGLYTLRIWERPELKWDKVEDIQLVWKYHYWTRFAH